MTNLVSMNSQNLANIALFNKEASTSAPSQMDKVQNTAQECLREYKNLCQQYSMGASDPELAAILLFSEKEARLLSTMSPEERSQYHQLCATSMATESHNPHERAVRASQQASVLTNFPVEIQVPGDGNCGLHAFARGFVAQMTEEDVGTLKVAMGTLTNPGPEARFVINRLDHKKGPYSALTTDKPFMTSLAKVLRNIGHQGIPEYYKETIAAMGDSEEVRSVMSNLIPEKNGEWVDHEGLISLGHILRKNVCVLRERNEGNVLVGHKTNPDIVINHKHNHFTARERRPV